MQIAFRVDSTKAVSFLSNLSTNIENLGDELPKEIAKMAAGEYIASAENAQNGGIKNWKGTFYGTLEKQRVNPRKLGKNNYGVSISAMKRGNVNYFVALDRMRPHKVSLRRPNTVISKWAYDHFDLVPRGIWVKPHPFINQADINIHRKIPHISEKLTRRAVKKSKR